MELFPVYSWDSSWQNSHLGANLPSQNVSLRLHQSFINFYLNCTAPIKAFFFFFAMSGCKIIIVGLWVCVRDALSSHLARITPTAHLCKFYSVLFSLFYLIFSDQRSGCD